MIGITLHWEPPWLPLTVATAVLPIGHNPILLFFATLSLHHSLSRSCPTTLPAFLYFLNVKENDCPKGVTVGFATCLLFVFLTIPAAIVAKLQYGVSLADSDWLHGSAESLLTITNLVTVVAFRQALEAKEASVNTPMPQTALSYRPMVLLVAFLTVLAGATALVPAAVGAEVHTTYLGGFMDLPFALTSVGANAEPENALTVAW